MICYKCQRPNGKGARECRPYGPGGQPICAGCAFGESEKPRRGLRPLPDVRATVEEQFRRRLDDASAKAGPDEVVAIGTEAGPIVIPAPGKPGRN